MKENKIPNTNDIKGRLPNVVTSQPITEWLTSERMFLAYRYKKQDIRVNPKTGKIMVPQPYVKDEESSDHKYALTFPQWQEIVETYWDIVVDNLIEGKSFKFPMMLGYIEMCKVKMRTVVMRGLKHSFRNLSTLGYKPKMIWRKNHTIRFSTKFWFMLNLSKQAHWTKMGKMLREDPSIIFKYPDIANTIGRDRIENMNSFVNFSK